MVLMIIHFVRNFAKNKGSAFVNLGGLVLGLTAFGLLYLYIENEFSYDRMHRRPEDIYRVVRDFVSNDGTRVPDATTAPALAPALAGELEIVEASTRIFPNRGRTYLIQQGDREFYEMNVLQVDQHFFDVFNFPLTSGTWDGTPANKTILITESMARKYFGEENPLNKILRFNLNGGTDFIVTGVLKDIPLNSHFAFDFVIPFENSRDANWRWSAFHTYVKLKPGSDPQQLLSGVTSLSKKHQPNSLDEYHIQPLTDIHLRSHLKLELSANGDIEYVRILIVIAAAILLIAGINYVNLTTANAVRRAKEVGVRKVTGAARTTLIGQFIGESVIMCVLAVSIAIVLISLILPFAGQVVGQDLSHLMSESRTINFVLPVSAVVFGLLSGVYPAVFLSSFNPLTVLRGTFRHSTIGRYFRQGLVVAQFTISTVLIIGALTIYQQVMFMNDKDAGFDKEHVMLLANVRNGVGTTVRQGDKLEEMKQLPGVTGIARADGIFGYSNSVNGVSKPGGNHVSLNFMRVDYGFLPVMGMELREGRNFSEEFKSDSAGIILNEVAVQQLGILAPAIGQELDWDDAAGVTHRVRVIGIVRDFHFRSLREAIQPFGFILEVGNGSTFFLKLQSKDLPATIDGIRKIWLSYNPDHPFAYTFQDDHMAQLTINEANFGKLFTFFTVLAIGIACIGLYGLVVAIGDARTKEIGIRKVLGGSTIGIVGLLSYDFMKLVAIALLLACPVAWMAMDRWLSSFAYRSNPGANLFLVAGVLTMLLVIITVSFRTIKIAGTNPTEALRSE